MSLVTVVRTEPFETWLHEGRAVEPLGDLITIGQGLESVSFNRREALTLAIELIAWAKAGPSTPLHP